MAPDAAFMFLGLLAGAFGVAYFPLFDRMARGFVSPNARADAGKRISAAVIDGSLVVSCLMAFRTQGSHDGTT